MPDVLTFGESLCVLHPASGETLRRGIGGAELNVAIALAQLGRSVTYVTRVGDDPFGAAIRAGLLDAGVDARVTVDPDAQTGVYFREIGGAGPRRVFYYRAGSAGTRLGPGELPPLEPYRIVHATGITASLAASTRATVDAASHAAAFTLDVNFRPALASEADWRDALLPLLDRIDVLFVSEDDAGVISAGRALAAGTASVVQMFGARGARYLDRAGTEVEAAARPVQAVDTVGAGDAFVAGFLDARLSGLPPADCLAAGCRLGADAATRLGDNPL